ncbi:MAG: oxygen-independent coproporphyrinogen III oxidase [Alicyclobacillaceae bacterium]|nr:oxygen-independent coproporphyrinogen III oxidase [Alicyclobacillaceae bacterium]
MERPAALYVHIPFCASRCHYCDFTTYVAPDDAVEAYVAALVREWELVADQAARPLQTVFFGGGTPSLLDARRWQRLLAALHRWFELAPDAEVTVEANPGTVDAEKFAVWRSAGVNRLSFGAQTFNDRLLAAIGRSHDARAVCTSVERAVRAGFTRINLDLMFGLPGQTLADVEMAVQTAVDLGVEHVSAYWLKVEPGTPFHEWHQQGRLQLPGEDLEADMYELVRERLQANGYVHYEVSNFARPGGESRHNLVYWRNEPYLGTGVGAHGYAYGVRYENVRSLAAYGRRLAEGVRPVASFQPVTPAESAENTMMLGLRLREGVSVAAFERRHGVPADRLFGEELAHLQRLGLVERCQGRVRLTERAWPVANAVFEAFVGVLTVH